MAETTGRFTGRVASIWRYPVKSMLGEELTAAEVSDHGLLGDRAYALVDEETGKVVSAKNPKRWPNLFEFHAPYLGSQVLPGAIPPAQIKLPDGTTISTDQPDVELRLSTAVGRPVKLAQSAFEGAAGEGYWPDYDFLEARDKTFQFQLPPGTFFDGAFVHLVSTTALARLRSKAPESRFDLARFRPNLLIEPTDGAEGFVENDWIGRTIHLGSVILHVEGPCPRCVMTTLSQGDLPKDPGILRTVVHENAGNVGVYASVVSGGRVQAKDDVKMI
jgi:uncharacterized protein